MKQRGQIIGPQKQRITVLAAWGTMLLFLCIKTPLACFCPMKNDINCLQTKTREDGEMKFFEIHGDGDGQRVDRGKQGPGNVPGT